MLKPKVRELNMRTKSVGPKRINRNVEKEGISVVRCALLVLVVLVPVLSLLASTTAVFAKNEPNVVICSLSLRLYSTRTTAYLSIRPPYILYTPGTS